MPSRSASNVASSFGSCSCDANFLRNGIEIIRRHMPSSSPLTIGLWFVLTHVVKRGRKVKNSLWRNLAEIGSRPAICFTICSFNCMPAGSSLIDTSRAPLSIARSLRGLWSSPLRAASRLDGTVFAYSPIMAVTTFDRRDLPLAPNPIAKIMNSSPTSPVNVSPSKS